MADESKHSVKLLVWSGVAAAGVHDLLQPGHVFSCKNIEWRSSSVSSWPVPSIYLSEHSVLSLHPKGQGAQPGCPAAAAHGQDNAVPGSGKGKSVQADEQKTL